MKKKYTVELDDNEVLIKFEIDKRCMNDFLGRTAQLTSYVCNPPFVTDDKREMYADAMIEDSVWSALNEPGIESTVSVIASPVTKEEFLDGKYQEVVDTYVCKEIFKNLGKFVGEE